MDPFLRANCEQMASSKYHPWFYRFFLEPRVHSDKIVHCQCTYWYGYYLDSAQHTVPEDTLIGVLIFFAILNTLRDRQWTCDMAISLFKLVFCGQRHVKSNKELLALSSGTLLLTLPPPPRDIFDPETWPDWLCPLIPVVAKVALKKPGVLISPTCSCPFHILARDILHALP